MQNLTILKEKFKQEKFKYSLIFIMAILFLFLSFREHFSNYFLDKNVESIHKNELSIFVQDGCIHCQRAEEFFNNNKFDNINVVYYNLKDRDSLAFLFKNITRLNIPQSELGTPIFVLDNNYIIGFSEESKNALLNLIKNDGADYKKEEKKEVNLGLFGKYNISNTSIFTLATVMGLADGFNPCAMWVLVYLISICMNMNSKKKILFLVGSFVLSSGILYFMFMTAWLNVFLYIGYIRVLAIAIGLFALYFGIMNIYEYLKSGGYIQCKLENNKSRNESMNKIKQIAMSDLSLLSIFAVVGLAFVVNSIEFACSAALPATFTFVLSKADLSTVAYYSYILLYTLFFMLDDLIIFTLALFAVNKYNGTKYEKYSSLIGGIVMLLIGFLIVFFPNALR